MSATKARTRTPNPLHAVRAGVNAAIDAIQRADQHADEGEVSEALALFARAKASIEQAEGALRQRDGARD
jgi:soluble cytochrome b562